MSIPKAGKCIYFNGVQNKTCRTGICYEELQKRGKDGMPTMQIPCNKAFDTGEIPVAACSAFEEPTEDEIARGRDVIAKAVERIAILSPLLGSIRKEQKGRNWRGIIECPSCRGRLHLSHAACNGHMRGQCETPNCYNFIE